MKTLRLLVITCASIWIFLWLAFDLSSFISCATNDSYKTPWYDNLFLKSPITNTVLLFYDDVVYETRNAVGDLWVIKETKVGDVEFWTITKGF